jgi:hypothetical protein
MEIIAKLRGHLQFSQDLNRFWIYFSNKKRREPSPRSRGPLLRPVHDGLMTGTGQRARRCMARGVLRMVGARCDNGKGGSWQRWTMVVAVLTSTAKQRGNGEVEPELGVDAG